MFRKNYIEIFIKCSLKELIKRDTKGLYKLARQKKIDKLIQSIFAHNNVYKKKFDSTVDLSYKNNWDNINKKLIDLFNEN